jgi:hypothetical protein
MSSYTVEGSQMIIKVVARHDAGTGRIYLPKEWVGEEVVIIRTGKKVEK